jgi:hypothetical protein
MVATVAIVVVGVVGGVVMVAVTAVAIVVAVVMVAVTTVAIVVVVATAVAIVVVVAVVMVVMVAVTAVTIVVVVVAVTAVVIISQPFLPPSLPPSPAVGSRKKHVQEKEKEAAGAARNGVVVEAGRLRVHVPVHGGKLGAGRIYFREPRVDGPHGQHLQVAQRQAGPGHPALCDRRRL